VEAFLKRDYDVVANSRNITKANPFPASPNLAVVDGDIGDPKTAAKIVDTVISKFGQVDVLINNAGVFIPKPFTEYTTKDFNALVSTTLAGFLYVSQLAVKQMLRQKSGSIVNVSSTLVGHAVAGVGNEVVHAVMFLTDATFTAGETLHVDGGAHAGKW
jgi:NAD(P)-dependent dehydrogenase (short-subunit alcohol dehydrogenase family)